MHRYSQGSVAQIAAGVEISFEPSGSDGFRLLTLRATLVTSAVVANRYPHFRITDKSGTVLHEVAAHSAQTAGQTVIYDLVGGSGSLNEGSAVNDGAVSLPLPDLWFPAGFKVVTVTTALDVGDQWDAISYSMLTGDGFEHLALLAEIVSNIGH